MKQIKIFILVALFSLFSLVASASETDIPVSDANQAERAEKIKNRVHEIWKMDFSGMEKIALREELKSIKKEIKRTEDLVTKISLFIIAIMLILLLVFVI